MSRDDNKVKLSPLAIKFLRLLNTKRGLAAAMAKAIDKPNSYFSEIRRGKPVNANHLRAAGLICGREAVLEILSIDDILVRDQIGDLQEDLKSPPGSTIPTRDTEGRKLALLRESRSSGRLSHEDLIGLFQNKALARELNDMLLQIEAADPEMLRRDVRRFLQGILIAIESKKTATDS